MTLYTAGRIGIALPLKLSLPVAEQRSQVHERVFHGGHNLAGGVSSQQQLSTVLEVAKSELVSQPLSHHGLELSLDVLLLHS